MAKLIHAASLAALKTAYSDWANLTSPIYNSIAYTDDGYTYTHGKIFQTSVVGSDNPWGLNYTLSGQTATVTVAGATKSINLPVINVVSGSINDLTVSSASGVYTITHKNRLTATTVGPPANSSSTILVPTLAVSATGHITSTSGYTATLDKVLQSASTGTTALPVLIGTSTSGGTDHTLYSTKVSITPSTGNLEVASLTVNGTNLSGIYAPINHASTATTYGIGTASNYGHVKLSDSIDSISTASSGIAASPKAVSAALAAAEAYAHTLLGTTDAMLFVGTINGTGVIQSYNNAVITQSITVQTTNISDLTAYSAGWTFKVTSAGTIANIGKVESGDMIICVKDYNTAYSASNFTVVQANIDGAVTIANNLVSDTITLGASATTIKSLANGTSGQYLRMGDSTPEWTTMTNKYRAINVNGTELLSNTNYSALNLTSGEGLLLNTSDNTVTIAPDFKTLNIRNNMEESAATETLEYNPIYESNFVIGQGLHMDYSDANNAYYVAHELYDTNGYTSTQGLYPITYDNFGHITSRGNAVTSLPNAYALTIAKAGTTIDTYIGSTAKTLNFVNGSNLAFTVATSNNVISVTPNVTMLYRPISYIPNPGTTAVTSLLTNSASNTLTIAAGTNVSITGTNGKLTINSTDTNTWRNVTAYTVTGTAQAGPSEILSSSIGTADLEFGSEFVWSTSENSLHLGWAEVASDGTITYTT